MGEIEYNPRDFDISGKIKAIIYKTSKSSTWKRGVKIKIGNSLIYADRTGKVLQNIFEELPVDDAIKNIIDISDVLNDKE